MGLVVSCTFALIIIIRPNGLGPGGSGCTPSVLASNLSHNSYCSAVQNLSYTPSVLASDLSHKSYCSTVQILSYSSCHS